MATQLTVVERAKQGEPDAIAQLMNRTLNQRAAHVQVRRRGGEYRLLVESDRLPEQQATVQWIEQGLRKLAIADMQTVTIYGKARQSAKPDWQYGFEIGGFAARSQGLPSESPQAASVTSSLTEPPLDLSEHCFIRNPSLLAVSLTPPAKPVAQAVLSFAALANAQKLTLLPHVASLLRKPAPIENPALAAEAQAWITEVLTLEGDDIRKLSIWLSRYCADPAATVAQLSLKAAPPQSESNPSSESSAASELIRHTVNPSIARGVVEQSAPAGELHSPDASLLSSNGWLPIWVLPAAWAFCLLVAVSLGIYSANNTEYSSALCEQVENPSAQCKLASQLVGEDAFLSEVLNPDIVVPPEITEKAAEKCQEYGEDNLLSAALFESSAKKGVSISNIHTEEVFPGVLLTDLKQTDNTGEREPMRIACVGYVTLAQAASGEFSEVPVNRFPNASDNKAIKPGDPLMIRGIAVDEIPMAWPTEKYDKVGGIKLSTKKALGVYNIFIGFGANTLFTAIGLFVAVMLNACYKCYTLKGIYQTASVLGVIETIVYMIPGLGTFISIPLNVTMLGLASCFVKDFNIDWSEGSKSVAVGVITIMVIRMILSWSFYGAIAHFIH